MFWIAQLVLVSVGPSRDQTIYRETSFINLGGDMRQLLTSLLLLFIFTVLIFFGGAVLKLFGSIDGPGVD
jgi:hypothetical protein